MKKNVDLKALVREATPLDDDCRYVLIANVLARKLGDATIFDDDGIIESSGTPLFVLDDFEPKALLHQKTGTLFVEGSVRTYALDWQSRAAAIPEEIAELVEHDERLSNSEIAELVIEQVLPELDELDDPDLADEIRARLSI